MKTLVIYAHPDHESHAKYTLELVEQKLKSKNIEYETIDLYKIGYNPVMSEKELYGSREERLDDQTKSFQQKITESNLLIFIYPVWWNTMPAIMKGFIDRVFSAGFAFKYDPAIPPGMKGVVDRFLALFKYRFNYGIPKGLLKGKHAIIFTTTGGPKLIAYPWTGNRFKKVIQKDMLGFFGIKSKLYYESGAYKLDDYQKDKVQRNINRAMNGFK